MARPLRIHYPGAVYHVTSRGNERRSIYRDDTDRAIFLEVLAHVAERYGWVVHAYCLMGNHYHLLVETPHANIAIGMRQLNGLYAQRFNRRHGRVGHLFQGRYAAILIQKERHFLRAARYVVRNPVRANLCASPEQWRCSSCAATAGLVPPPAFLTVEPLRRCFGDGGAGCTGYLEFVSKEDSTFRADLRGEIYLGDDVFARTHADPDASPEVPRTQRHPVTPELQELFDRHGRHAIAIAYRDHGYSLRQIADHLGIHYATVSRRLRTLEDEAA